MFNMFSLKGKKDCTNGEESESNLPFVNLWIMCN